MRLNCRGEGCPASIEVEKALPFATYTCKLHVAKRGEDKMRFQESQFDPRIGTGTDPRAYEKGHAVIRGTAPQNHGNRVSKKRSFEKAEKALDGHENREEIIKILKKNNVEDQS